MEVMQTKQRKRMKRHATQYLFNILKWKNPQNSFYKLTRPVFIESKSSDYITFQENSYNVHPGFGKLLLKSKCNCIIRPSCPQRYPDANYASVTIRGLNAMNEKLNVETELLENDDLLKIEISPEIPNLYCEISIPLKYDIEADLEDGANLQVQKLESDKIDITTQHGSVITKNIKSEEVSVTTDSGTITAEGALQGNIYINAKSTTVKAERLQGMELCIQADNLKTEIESSYMVKGSIFSRKGDVNIKHLHGSTDLHLDSGKIFINGLHGGLRTNISEGDAEIQVTEVTEESSVQIGKGDLRLSFTDVSDKCLEVVSNKLDISEDVKLHGQEQIKDGLPSFKTKCETSPSFRALVNEGTLKLSLKDWFSSLGIKLTN